MCFSKVDSWILWVVRYFIFDFYLHRYKGDFTSMGRMLTGVLSGGNTQEDLDRAVSFMKRHDIGSAKLAGDQAIATIKSQMKWVQKFEKIVVDWFNSRV